MRIDDSPREGNGALRQAAECFQEYLRLHGQRNQYFDVLRFLADETLKRLDEGKEAKFHNLAIQMAVVGQTKKDPSSWISPIWKKLTSEVLAAREEGLQEFARAHGLEHYPWIARQESSGGAGNQTLYYLETREIRQAEIGRPSAIDLPEPDIRYIAAEHLKPSWWAGWLFGKDLSATGWRKALFVWAPIVWFIVMGIFVVTLFLLLGQSKNSVTTQDLLSLLLLAVVGWYMKQRMDSFVRLVDDRVVMAPEHLVSIKEFGVCLELAKPEGSTLNDPRSLRLIKYAAECPICSAEVLLDAGEPQFPRRLVGRCQESPREHVFSFDRVRKAGYRLE